ncbi:MAG: hypothetical protein EWM47_00720, partial [Anaerolineaceae bacterium]
MVSYMGIKRKGLSGIVGLVICLMLIGCDYSKLGPNTYKEVENNEPNVIKPSLLEDKEMEVDIFSQDSLKHEPYGWDNLYGQKEVPVIWWDRTPRDPQEGDAIKINIAVDEETADMDIWLKWKLNGVEMEAVTLKHLSNLKASGTPMKKYQGKLGPFKQGDRIEYTICAGENKQEQKISEAYEFAVYKWEPILEIEKYIVENNALVLNAKTISLAPSITLALIEEGTLKISLDLKAGDFDHMEALPVSYKDTADYCYIYNEELDIEITKAPFSLRVMDIERNKILTDIVENGFEILTDGVNVKGFRYDLYAPPKDEFYGFGMKYDALNQRNKTVHTYCVNWYKDQIGETYTPVPYYFVPDKYGFYVDTSYYSKFEIDTVKENICSIEVNTGSNKGVDSYLFFGDNASIADRYTNISGKPVLPPVWAFGPWISANEWNKQSEVMEQLSETIKNNIPTSVIVLEAWSDEETFYTFNDSKYEPQNGYSTPILSDFKFGGRWPDPKEMINKLHENNVKVLLWQIPVLKHSASATIQSLRDQDYAIKQGYVLKNKDKSPYRLPDGTWFGNSLLVDFTSREATEWFMSKRQYLLKELGIDGFKTDGGEFVWGRNVMSSDGTMGDELRNAYPDLYAQAYFDYSRNYVEDAITFSRAGGSSMQKHPVCWVGDQSSTPQAFEEAILATVSASMSGIPFVAWDIAGFSGDLPSSELYQRAVAQAAFSPIMQVHSETSGDPVPSQARTPWNMAERKGSEDCLDTYRYFANIRMNLLPYIYSAARHSSITGEPLMRSMAYSFPGQVTNDKYQYQYMFGDSLLVAPLVDVTKKMIDVYLPEGNWYGLFDNESYKSGTHTIECLMGELPVFVREGTILPLNLNEKLELGGYVGNETESYKNLTFRIYPGEGTYLWYDFVNNCEVEFTSSTDSNEIIVRGLKIP